MAKQIEFGRSGKPVIFLQVFFCTILICAVYTLMQAQEVSQPEFDELLLQALSAGDTTKVVSLIHDNRLKVKPVVNNLINKSITEELAGEKEESKQALRMADLAASVFEDLFHERSLVTGVQYLKKWTVEEKAGKLEADSLYVVGTAIRTTEPEKAVELYGKALEIYREIGDGRGEAEILGGLGFICSLDPTKDREAMTFFREALAAREKVDDKPLIGNSLNSIGIMYYNIAEDSEAISYFDRAIRVREEIGDEVNLTRTKTLKANSCLSYGSVLNSKGKFSEAIKIFDIAYELYNELGDRNGAGRVLNQMGLVYSGLGEYNVAVDKTVEAITIFEEENDTSGLAGCYNHIGIALQASGRLEMALGYYDQSLGFYEGLNDKEDIVAVLSNLGTLYFDMKEYQEAEKQMEKALDVSRQTGSRNLEANCLLNLANSHVVLGKLDTAYSEYKSGLEIARRINSADHLWRYYVGMAEINQKWENYLEAVALNDSALKIIDEIRGTLLSNEQKSSYLAKERYAFEGVISMLGSLYDKDRSAGYDLLSFRYAEQAKSRTLLDLLAESIANLYAGPGDSLITRQESVIAGLARSRQQLTEVSLADEPDHELIRSVENDIRTREKELGTLKEEIRKTNPRYAELIYPGTVTLRDVQSMCPDKNIVFLEYSVGDSSSSLWVITKTNYRLFVLPGRKKLEEQVEALRFALLDPFNTDRSFLDQAGYALYSILVKPAESFLTKRSSLVVIPDGILNYLPFEVLLTENRNDRIKSYTGLPFLVKKHPISYVQSASILKSLLAEYRGRSGTRPGNTGLIAFGDPVYGDTYDSLQSVRRNLSRLEYSGREVEKIASLFGDGASELFLGENATEENVKREGELKKYKYVHFATHGIIDEKKPDLSSLVLTRTAGSREDGLLSASEIFNLDLKADLVVLSACRTGLGKLVRGEGMVGLTRAFMYAGTPAVMVSLWSVSDISTATLMREFYRDLLKKGFSKTEALRNAQLSLLEDEKYAHPFYWAPFVLIGDWR
jgi:CHAT domain-containing protein